jgi:hypothetical protein
MGIAASNMELLLLESAQRPFRGRALVLGRQAVQFEPEYLRTRAAIHGVPVRDLPVQLSPFPSYAKKGFPSDEWLFKALGCDSLDALDFSDSEGANLVHDLNRIDLPEDVIGRYDLIFDGGTLEHVFHTPNALLCIHDLLAMGGQIIHSSPMNNLVDHGFYQFCPTFFTDYYGWNFFDIGVIKLNRLEAWEFSTGIGGIFDYDPEFLKTFHFGVFGSAVWTVFASFTKTPASTRGRIPVQGRYSSSAPARIDCMAAIRQLTGEGIREACIYGGTDLGVEILALARENGINVPRFVDDAPELTGKAILGVPVISLNRAKAEGYHVYIVADGIAMREICTDLVRVYSARSRRLRIVLPLA